MFQLALWVVNDPLGFGVLLLNLTSLVLAVACHRWGIAAISACCVVLILVGWCQD